MDFLEIRRKAKERAAARAAGAAGAPAPEARAPLALEPPRAPPPSEAPAAAPAPAPTAEPAPQRQWRPPPPPRVPVEPAVADALDHMPVAEDARFRTWRPDAGPAPALEPVGFEAPEVAQPPAAPPARPADPLVEFFYRDDEAEPDLGALPSPAPAEARVAPETLERDEFLTFLLGQETYGVAIERVREVMRAPPVTEVPHAPPGVLGVITVRGEVVAVFDPRGRLGLPSAEGAGRVVIVDGAGGPCGLLVDAVASVIRLPRGSLEPCPQGIGGAAADCLVGIGREREALFTVLDVDVLLKPAIRAGELRP